MNLLTLGSTERSLFAIHEPAAETGGRLRAAVICNPWGEEYTYAHRSLRHLATRLTRSGVHVLRFDYHGTGDSGGDESDVTLAGLESDIGQAVEAAQDVTGARQITLIGLRLGANLAVRGATRVRGDVNALVVWDPLLASFGDTDALPEDLRAAGLLSHSPADVPARTLVVLTDVEDPLEVREKNRLAPASAAVRAAQLAHWPEVASARASCCWAGSATTTGALPAAIFERIETWLK